jgi:hypothetical protein
MATRGRKPKAKEVKEFYINNESTFNKAWQKKTNVFSSTAQFFNIFPKNENEFYLTPVKKGERLGYGKYRIVGHYDNAKSDDRDAVMANRKSKDLVFKDPLTTPSRIKYDAYKGTYGYHLITHDRDGKRVEVPIVGAFPNKQTGNFVATILADMNIPDASHKRSSKNRNKKGKIMSCPVNAGSLAISTSNPGKLKLVKKTPKAECSKYGNKTGFSPKEYERDYDPKKSSTKDAESTEEFLSESDLIYYYSAQGIEMDLSDYVAMDSVTVDDTSYQPAQNYGAEWMAEFCAGCGNHKSAEGCGCMGAESDSATYEPSSEPDMVNEIPTEPTNAEMNAESLEDFNGMESVVVEPPLGHGVAQWMLKAIRLLMNLHPNPKEAHLLLNRPTRIPTYSVLNQRTSGLRAKTVKLMFSERKRVAWLLTMPNPLLLPLIFVGKMLKAFPPLHYHPKVFTLQKATPQFMSQVVNPKVANLQPSLLTKIPTYSVLIA